MTKFIEITIEGKIHSINIDNIALLKQINEHNTEIHLITKNENDEQIKFQVAYNYMFFRALLNDDDRLGFNFILNEFK